jgi:hypothetical protein
VRRLKLLGREEMREGEAAGPGVKVSATHQWR